MDIVKCQCECCRSSSADAAPGLAYKLHPEDLRVGDFVTISEETYEFPTFFWFSVDPSLYPPDEKIRISFRPSEEALPLTIRAICLPYVLCRDTDEQHRVLDVRQVALVHLSRDFATLVKVTKKADRNRNTNDRKKKKKK